MSIRVEGIFVLRPVATSASSRPSISELSTKRLKTKALFMLLYVD
jgi:hypothetical protein